MDDPRTALSLPAPLLGVPDAAFIQRGVSILVASRGPGNAPSIARASGCRISPDRREVTVLLAAAPSAPVLRDLERSGAVAAVFSRPSTHRTIQLKGSDARLGPLAAGDLDLSEAYRESFVQDLLGIGWGRPFAIAVIPRLGDAAVAVAFTPVAAFDQTPGRTAGQALRCP